MRRRGHGRPLGTTTRVRMRWSSTDMPDGPELEDVTNEESTDRCYLVAGVEEHRDSPAVWWLVLERISIGDYLDRVEAGAREWSHTRDRR